MINLWSKIMKSMPMDHQPSVCNCVGPQNGQPACPCAMRSVRIIKGRYVRIQDLGPAPDPEEDSHDHPTD